MENLLYLITGSISVLLGVALGAYIVFRTKRDPSEPFFGSSGRGESFNIDDNYDTEDLSSKTILPEPTEKANNAFVEQLKDKIGK